jgi:glycosyltransferase involved in cell wall biosynthesis
MLSCCASLIVRNEERNLPGCLKALQGVAREIVIVDTGSNDRTVEIARDFTEQVFFFSWRDDFAAARNFALDHVASDYILSVDADERLLEPERATELLESFIAQNSLDVIGAVDIISLLDSKSGAQEVRSVLPRFFRKDRFRFKGAIHEQIVHIEGVNRSAHTGLRFAHTGYLRDAAVSENKSLRNIRLLRAAMEKHPDDEYLWLQLGKAHFATDAYAEAREAFEHALNRICFENGAGWGSAGPLAPDLLTDLVVSLAYAYVNTNNLEKAIAMLSEHERFRRAGSDSPDFYHALGYVHLMAGDVARSREAYKTSLRYAAAREQVLGTASFGSHYHLGLLHEAEGDLASACGCYLESLRGKPDYAPALSRCVDLITEHKTLAPPEVWNACDALLLKDLCLTRLQQLIEAKRVDDAMLLLRAVKSISKELFEACAAFLREIETNAQDRSYPS